MKNPQFATLKIRVEGEGPSGLRVSALTPSNMRVGTLMVALGPSSMRVHSLGTLKYEGVVALRLLRLALRPSTQP